jgi:hypothetical protein
MDVLKGIPHDELEAVSDAWVMWLDLCIRREGDQMGWEKSMKHFGFLRFVSYPVMLSNYATPCIKLVHILITNPSLLPEDIPLGPCEISIWGANDYAQIFNETARKFPIRILKYGWLFAMTCRLGWKVWQCLWKADHMTHK